MARRQSLGRDGESGGPARFLARTTVALALLSVPALPQAQTQPPAKAPAKAPPLTNAKAPAAAAPAKGPPRSPQLEAAMQAALKGDTRPLLKMADGGDADAQYHAGELYLFGSSAVPKDPPRGCAYEQKASSIRADAMHLVGLCHQSGGFGAVDKAKAETAFMKASQMGFAKSKCTLGQMLMADQATRSRGLSLCKEAGNAGDIDAQMAVANAYFSGTAGGKPDHAQARRWYDMAAKQNSAQANRRLGEMYANGDGGKKDTKKALEHWTRAEKAGDPLVAILVADQMFSDMTGGRKPGAGTYAFKGGVPVEQIKVIKEWYQLAQARDPRPDVKERAKYALAILASLKTGAVQAQKSTQAKKK